jgi:ribosomal protein L17
MLRCFRRTDKFAKIPNNDLRQHKSLMKIIGKLRVHQETKVIERYGEYGLAAVTDSIRQLQNAIAENYTEKQFTELFNKIDNIYASRHEGYMVGLCDYSYNDDAADASQAQLRIEKLQDFRNEELRKLKLA